MNTIEKQMFPAIIENKLTVLNPVERKVIQKYTLLPRLVNITGDLYAKVWMCTIYEHYVKQPTKKTLYTEDNEAVEVMTYKWVLEKTTLKHNEKAIN